MKNYHNGKKNSQSDNSNRHYYAEKAPSIKWAAAIRTYKAKIGSQRCGDLIPDMRWWTAAKFVETKEESTTNMSVTIRLKSASASNNSSHCTNNENQRIRSLSNLVRNKDWQ